MISRRSLLRAAAAAPLVLASGRAALAASPEVFAFDGLAIRGADPVAYFRQSALVFGQPDMALMWHGAEWRFASADAREAFEMDPLAYAPQFGGYCAYAMSLGAIATTVPEAWTIHQGRLYLNFSLDVRTRWAEDKDGNIARANGYWPDILG